MVRFVTAHERTRRKLKHKSPEPAVGMTWGDGQALRLFYKVTKVCTGPQRSGFGAAELSST